MMVYGLHLLGDIISFLDYLVQLQQLHLNEKFIVGGEFNMITSLDEENGRVHTLNIAAQSFKYEISHMHLAEIEIVNGIYN